MPEINNTFIPASFYNAQTGQLTVDKKLAETVQAGVQARVDNLPPAEQQVFLGMVANLAPGDVDTPEELNAVLNAFEAAAKQLGDASAPVTAFVGDISRFLARALIEFAADQRQNALNERLAAREAAQAELLSQSGKMQDAANKMMTGAITALITGVIAAGVAVAGSATSAIGTFSQIGKMGSSMKATNEASKASTQASEQLGNLSKLSGKTTNVDDLSKITNATKAAESAQSAAGAAQQAATKVFDTANAKTQLFTALGQTGNAVGDMTRSGGSSTDARLQAEAKGLEAEGSKDAAEAQYAQGVADMKKDIQEQMNEMIKQIINFLKEMQDAEVEAMRAITRG